jgi:hypothetical protein
MEKVVEIRLDLWPPGGPPDRTIRSVNGRRVTLPVDGWTLRIDDRSFETFPVPLTLEDMREVTNLREGLHIPDSDWCEEALRQSFGFEGRPLGFSLVGPGVYPIPGAPTLVWACAIDWMHPGRRYDSFLLCIGVHPDHEWARAALIRLARKRQLALTGWSGTVRPDDDSLWDGFFSGVQVSHRTGALALEARLALSASGIPTEGNQLRGIGADSWYLDGR